MKLKKVLGALFLTGSLITLAACGGAQSNTKEDGSKVYELNLNVSAAPTSPFNEIVAKPWAEYVEKETGGKVKVNVFPSAALGSLSTALDDINAGVYEAGLVPPGLHVDTDLFPLTIADTPFLVNSPEIAQKVLTKFVDKFMKDTFVDGTFMSVSSTDSYQIYSTKPIKSAADLDKQKLSDSVAGRLELFKELGAVPVSLANTELYESLERGVVDSVAYTAVGANGYKLGEVAPYMTKVDLAVSTLPFLINTNFLNSLPKDIKQQFIEDFGPKYANLMTELYTSSAEESVKTFETAVKDKGGSVYVPSEKEMEDFKKPVKKEMEAWVKEADKRGYKGQEMMDYFVELLEAEGVKVPK
ncbi:TRAP transporter substrate-binding protein DctP [Neobacillus sp. 179-C4.2 HS]|uniref:TRAP transporter substrate-binding protein DctP n=1 Tax=Neobacillus driksii TaxID=3035913 RepID=A0ABV4YSP7_9BACI|nr:TRAP transporter substrate-binding protein DctP [Neobacillus sp. 179.-C4.2 HS]MDP5195133.1 TRAP transporter substrate-binding protein DctP [Neobacillus sp. 179.-C4.2 HS]